MLLSPCGSFESGMEDEMPRETEGNRPRSRTWPLPQPEDFEAQKSPEVDDKNSTAKIEAATKKGSRKNAWGNQSYADLITQAIQSTPEQRMTLSQIYSWMVENVVYFKDKGDNTSSAGWKNSIRHNLSLHNRFIRIQNEGNGKSSWWMVDTDAKTEKTKRRSRSSSLDSDNGPKATKTKRPGRKGKRCDVGEDKPLSPNSKLRVTPKSPISSETSVILEDNSFPFPLDYRNRSSSNASNVSSISGRLSPIPSHDEDLDIEQEMSLSPPQEQQSQVVVEELMDNMKENLNMTIARPQQPAQADISAYISRFNEDSISMDTAPPATQQFVDNRYPNTPVDYFPASSIKQAPFKAPAQKDFSAGTLQQHLNNLYHIGKLNSTNTFQTIPERRSMSQVMIPNQRAPPPPYSMSSNTMLREQPMMSRPTGGGGSYTPYFHSTSNEPVPMISVEMADSVALPGDFDIEFLERLDRDITCDVESVLRNDSAFNDGHLDFNLDNYVSAIALPDISVSNHISGNMVH